MISVKKQCIVSFIKLQCTVNFLTDIYKHILHSHDIDLLASFTALVMVKKKHFRSPYCRDQASRNLGTIKHNAAR